MTRKYLMEKLNLKPLEIEGGYFCEVYRSSMKLEKDDFPPNGKAESYSASTSIYYLLGSRDISRMHCIAADETWHFYAASESGIYISLLAVSPEGKGEIVKLGADISSGQVPQFTVPGGYMVGAYIARDGVDANYLEGNDCWVLAGATVAPSFEYKDFKRGDAAEIALRCPQFASEILKIG